MIKELTEVREALAYHVAQTRPIERTDQAIAKLDALIAQEKAEPVARGAFYFGGKYSGDLYAQCKTKAEIDAYIGQVHQSNDSITLKAKPLYTAPPARQPLTDTDIAAAIEVADAKWADADVPLGWAKHFARAIEAKIGAKP